MQRSSFDGRSWYRSDDSRLKKPKLVTYKTCIFWKTSLRCVFLNKVPIIPPNITYRSSTVVFYYTLQHVLAVLRSYHQAGVGHTEIFFFFLCIRHLSDDGWSAHPKHVVLKTIVLFLYVMFVRTIRTLLRNTQRCDVTQDSLTQPGSYRQQTQQHNSKATDM
jgi:hypothetical protein